MSSRSIGTVPETDCPDAESLLAYVEGSLPPARRDAVMAHLDGCAVCRQVTAELGREENPQALAGDDATRDESLDDPSLRDRTSLPLRPGDSVAGERIGTTIGSYKLVSLLGRGAMGAVYKAIHTVLDRKVAIKVIHADIADEPALVERFFNEARAVNRIRNKNIVDITDVGRLPDGTVYFVMEYLVGESLASRIHREGALDIADTLHIARQVARALGASHRKGIIHRDLKPENVFLVDKKDGVSVKVLDFGLAKLAYDATRELTRQGSVIGTLHYMAPEQCQNAANVDHRADIYSLGVMLFKMLVGSLPFDGNRVELMRKHMHQEPPPLRSRRPNAPAWLEAVTARALAKDREARYPSMEAMADALQHEGGSIPSSHEVRTPSRPDPEPVPYELEETIEAPVPLPAIRPFLGGDVLTGAVSIPDPVREDSIPDEPPVIVSISELDANAQMETVPLKPVSQPVAREESLAPTIAPEGRPTLPRRRVESKRPPTSAATRWLDVLRTGRGIWLLVGAGAFGMLLAGIVITASSPPQYRPVKVVEPPPPPAPAPVPPAPKLAPVPPPVRVAPAPERALAITTVPPDARLELDDQEVANPLARSVPAGQKVRIAVSAPGYKTHRAELDMSRNEQLVIRLEKVPRRKRGRR